jgi:hypothetical protein
MGGKTRAAGAVSIAIRAYASEVNLRWPNEKSR